MRKFKLPLAIGAGALGAATLGKRPGGTIRTDEGYNIPDITEMAPKIASQAVMIHLIECAQSPAHRYDFSSIKLASLTTLDQVAAALGSSILASP